MHITTLQNALWAAGFLGHAALFAVLLFRHKVREFPVFSGLIAFQGSVTILLFLVSRYASAHSYAVCYWVTGFADYAFQVALIFELAHSVLRPTGTWVRDARRSFLLWGGAGLLLAAGLALCIGPPEARGLELWQARITWFTSLLTCELFLAMATAANRLGLVWRSPIMAIGQGLTAWAGVALLGDLAHIVWGWNRSFALFDNVLSFTYVGVLVFWIVVFLLPERQRAPVSPEMREYLLALHRRVQYDLDRLAR